MSRFSFTTSGFWLCMAFAVAIVGTTMMDAPIISPAEARDQHCRNFNRVYGPVSAPSRRAIDDMERSDGIEIDCEARVMDFKREISVPLKQASRDWLQRKTNQWDTIHCKNDKTRDALSDGWKIVSTLTFADGQKRMLTANCR